MPSTVKFDYAAARKAGFTDEQIAASLAAKRAAGLDVYVDKAEVDSVRGSATPRVASPAPPMMVAGGSPVGSFVASPAGRALLPGAGGFVGGLVGKLGGYPGAIGGAAVGGGLGEGAREILSGERLDPSRIAREGGLQGGYEAVGGAIGKLAGRAAVPLMKRALRPSQRILREFPDVVETTLRRDLPVTPGGVAKASGLREASAAKVLDLLDAAKSTGVRFNTRDITKHVRILLQSKVLPDKEKEAIAARLVAFNKQQGQRLDPVLLREIKQFYQKRASAAYRAKLAGGMSLAAENRALFSEKLARGAREQLETIPGVGAQEAETQSLIGAQRAIEGATMRTPPPLDIGRPGTYPIARRLAGPTATSFVARKLASPRLQFLLRQIPRGTAAAIVAQLTQPDEPDATMP